MKNLKWKKMIAGVLTAVLLAGSLPDFRVDAAGNLSEPPAAEETDASSEEEALPEEAAAGEVALEEPQSTEEASGEETGAEETDAAETIAEETEESVVGEDQTAESEEPAETEEIPLEAAPAVYQYVIFPDNGDDVIITVPESVGVTPLENVAETVLYKINTSETEEFVFTAAVRYGYRLEIPESFAGMIAEKSDRDLVEGRWIYTYVLTGSKLCTTETVPASIRLALSRDVVPVEVNGAAIIEGIDEDSMAQLGSEVSIEVTQPGYTLAMLTRDEKGNDVYTAMELDYDNRYRFTAEEQVKFFIVDPEQVDYTIVCSETRKAKLTGVAGIKLNSLTSSAQGYKEVVLNFTAVKNGSDGTETESVYYEVKVTAVAQDGEELPAGSSTVPQYYYIPKVENANTQSKSIQVNSGDLSAPTACTYEFSVRMVLIDKSADVPDEDTAVAAPLEVNLSGNTVTRSFATKNLYYEDKLGFTKKNTKIYTGQENVLAGVIKYSKNASYIHDLTAVVYDSRGEVCDGFDCVFLNDNDELYVSAEYDVSPGKYKVVVYAGIGEEDTVNSPQGGTMYQANTSFTLTVEPSIYSMDTSGITKQVAVNSKDVTFSVVPVGYSYYSYQKTKSQKFTYEIKSAVPDSDSATGYTVTEPVDKVKDNISVNQSGKVTVKRGYYVDPDTSKNYIAVVIKAADFEGNEANATAYVQIVTTALVPTTIYLTDSKGNRLGTTVSADKANGAYVVVLDQNGNNMNQYVTVTPTDNAKRTAGIYVSQSTYDGTARLYVRKLSSVTIKATSKDGGKKSKSVKFTITSPSFTEACYSIISIKSDGFSASEITTATGKVTYSAPKGAVIEFLQGAKINGVGYYNRNWFDWKYTVTGGKLKFDGSCWLLTPTAKVTDLKVWIKSNPKRWWTIQFINENWGTTYESAPKVELVQGRLYSNKYTNLADVDVDEEYGYAYVPSQQLTYQYEYGSYDSVEIARISNSGPYLYVSSFDPENRTFVLSAYAGDDFKPGNYKYKIAFYRDDTLMCKPASITVKVNKASPVKITSSYTLNSSQGDSVELKCTPNGFIPDFDTKLLNANVGGKANDFNTYFELAYVTDAATGAQKAVIRFKSAVTDAEKESLKGKSLTGYVKYSYYYGYSLLENVTTKVTIKIK